MWWLKAGLLGVVITYMCRFGNTFMESKNFKHFDVELQEVRSEHRSFSNALLLVLMKTGCFPIDGFIFQRVASILTVQFNAANVDFALSGTNPSDQLRSFVRKHGISVDIDVGNAGGWEWSKRPNEYRNLNEFFMRRYREFNVTTTPSRADELGAVLLSSPATSVVQQYASIGRMGEGANAGLLVKGERFTLESTGVPNPEQYSGKRCFYLYLSPADYHCFHSPMSGTIERLVDLTGLAHCSGSVKPDLIGASPSILTHNRRIVVVIKHEGLRVAMVIIGGFLVDSIRMDPAVREGGRLEAGQYLGAFALGGSAILLLSNRDLSLVGKLADGLEEHKLPVKVTAGKEFAVVAA
mmetsp:Transcript_5511/g.9377  ORF Transcript_5511/g.9377 Transcript_5511/m.9377 type:complete len:353 (+) Transcript_5511:76-1134(+)